MTITATENGWTTTDTNVHLWAVVYYPGASYGANRPVVPGHHPLVVYLHGNHGIWIDAFGNHTCGPPTNNPVPNHQATTTSCSASPATVSSPPNPLLNSLGAANVNVSLNPFGEPRLANSGGAFNNTFFQDTKGLISAWNTSGAEFILDVPLANKNVTACRYIS